MIELWAAFMLGLVGSLHCVGMCGPIVLALPLTSKEKGTIIFQSTLYHLGRITTYTIMGLLLGVIGWGITLAGYQKWISIGLGLLLLISAFSAVSLEQKIFSGGWPSRILNRIKFLLKQNLSISSTLSAFKIGLLNGILPCGMVYIALAGALVFGDIYISGLYMLSFGIGTIPLMLAVMIFGKLNWRITRKFQKYAPILIAAFGLLLIYRGVAVDLPLSLLPEAINDIILCH